MSIYEGEAPGPLVANSAGEAGIITPSKSSKRPFCWPLQPSRKPGLPAFWAAHGWHAWCCSFAKWWARTDSNREPPGCEVGAHSSGDPRGSLRASRPPLGEWAPALPRFQGQLGPTHSNTIDSEIVRRTASNINTNERRSERFHESSRPSDLANPCDSFASSVGRVDLDLGQTST